MLRLLLPVVAVTFTALWVPEADAAGCPTTPTQYCNRKKSDLKGWDTCTQEGTFKSISQCYMADTGKYVSRYDMYKCKRYRGNFIIYRVCCPGPVSPTPDYTDVFNRYNTATGRCDLPPPVVPPTTTGSSAVMVAF